MPTPLTQNQVRDLFNYDPDTGSFTWKIRPRNGRVNIGDEAGTYHRFGKYVKIDKQLYRVSILIWVWYYGHWPKGIPHEVVEHINKNPFNNRINNLRLATSKQNSWNSDVQTDNSSGYTGVAYHKTTGKWQAYITVHGRNKYLGLFQTLEAAADARRVAEFQHYGEHAP